jgi:hypothetical protein
LSSTATEPASYVALRVCTKTAADPWWAAVRLRHDVPPAVAALLAGRARVEVSQIEADEALEWAGGVEGWAGSTPKPLFVHTGTPVLG